MTANELLRAGGERTEQKPPLPRGGGPVVASSVPVLASDARASVLASAIPASGASHGAKAMSSV